MQKLYFETAWERTIAQNDREKIIKIFEKVQPTLSSGVHFTFLWAAKNHENETLITTLIHNVRPHVLQLTNTIVAYKANTEVHYTHKFDVKEPLPAHSSMPCTFIFSRHATISEAPDYVISVNNTS